MTMGWQRRSFLEPPVGPLQVRDDLFRYHLPVDVVSALRGFFLIFNSAISIERRRSSSSIQVVNGTLPRWLVHYKFLCPSTLILMEMQTILLSTLQRSRDIWMLMFMRIIDLREPRDEATAASSSCSFRRCCSRQASVGWGRGCWPPSSAWRSAHCSPAKAKRAAPRSSRRACSRSSASSCRGSASSFAGAASRALYHPPRRAGSCVFPDSGKPIPC